jgi:Holliday junction resolvase RusA-like endonuclease
MKGWTVEALESKGVKVRDQTMRVIATPSDLVTLSLPLPPSVNHAWQNVPGKGRVRSPEYRRWHKLAFDELCLQKPGKIVGEFCAVINCGKINRRADIDNRIKPLLDLIKGTVIEDDSKCARVSAGWVSDVPAERVVMIIRSAA